VLRAAVICWFAATELLSITDHAARLGLPVPPALTGVIAALRVRGGDTPRDRDAN
jgi:phage-related holin